MAAAGLPGLLSRLQRIPDGDTAKAVRVLDGIIAAAEAEADCDAGLVRQLQRARDLYPKDPEAARALVADIADAGALLTLGAGNGSSAAAAADGASVGVSGGNDDARSLPHQAPSQQQPPPACSAAEAAWRTDWQGRVLDVLTAGAPALSNNSNSPAPPASPGMAATSLSALREQLQEAVRMSQSSPLARVTLVPLELKRALDSARSPADLVAGLASIVRQFVVPLYHQCRSCGARRLALREPVPPPGRFTCGHMSCLFSMRECKPGGWDEAKDWKVGGVGARGDPLRQAGAGPGHMLSTCTAGAGAWAIALAPPPPTQTQPPDPQPRPRSLRT